MRRLPPQPSEAIARDRPVTFTFDGRTVAAFEGDTIGSALMAAGRSVLSRSFKYHRPRGALCCTGQCGNCLVAVDGAPGVRACTEPARDGMTVEHLNAWPALDRDLMRVVDKLGGPFTPPGFYYKTFIRPRRLWPLYERLLRRVAGLGRLAREQDDRLWRTDYRRRHADVLVLGGGVAGLAAAVRAAQLGADTVLVDDGAEPGGRLLAEGGVERARYLTARAREASVEILSPAVALGYFDGLVPVWAGDTLHQIRARRYVVATGTIEQPLLFDGNDLPGVMLAGGVLRLLNRFSIAPGRRAVVSTTGDRGVEAAIALHEAGVEVVAVADLRGDAATDAVARAVAAGLRVLPRASVITASGRRGVRRAVVAELDASGSPVDGTEHELAVDLVVVSGPDAPAASLLLQAGATPAFDESHGRFVLGAGPAGTLMAGDLTGEGDRDVAEISGAVAGATAATEIGFGSDRDVARLARERDALAAREVGAPTASPPALPPVPGKRAFVCQCEDVTAKDLAYSIDEGYDSIELSKRYTTVTMGPCQGRMCQLACVRAVSELTGQDPAVVGLTTARPPWSSVPVGALAGRPFEPAKRSSIHGRHRELGADVQWAGDWRRPYHYGDPAAEVRAVHDAAGLIDVSSLGKLVVRGPDAAAFLDRLYPNRFANLAQNRIRYGVLTSDAGRILDDGTICRLDEDSFYVTTTSSGAGAVEEWFSWWLADWRMDVHVADVTQALCAINLAGPLSREVLARVSDIDCTADGFKYLDARHAEVAGVPALLLRIGFVGELGYEIHFPSSYGEHVWNSILDAGADRGIRPFGLEPQRVLRLEKQHIIVGQDTDSESDPYASAMSWIVKLDKDEDFVGRWALEHAADRPADLRLVGFRARNGHTPAEGAAVVVDGRPAGRVTSSRRSEKVGASIGLAWVPAHLARDGSELELLDSGRQIVADVFTSPFYDPDGERLRS